MHSELAAVVLAHSHWGSGWGVVALIGMAVGMTAMMGGMGWMMWSMMRRPRGDAANAPEDPIEVLKRRYAAGELTTEEFQERLRTMKEAQ